MRAWVLVAVLQGACGRVGFTSRSDASADSGDGAADDGGVTACNQLHAVHDDFSTSIDYDLWGGSFTDPGTSIQVTGGEVILSPATSAATSMYCGVGTARYYDMRGERFVAEITRVGTNGAVVGIEVRLGAERIDLSETNGMLRAAYSAPTYTAVQQRPYSAATDRFWSIAESAGTISWETSVDGTSFTPFAQAPAPFDVSLVRAQLFAGSETAVAAPGSLHVTAAGNATAAAAPVCSSDLVVDKFDSNVLERTWLNSFTQPCCTMNPVSGQLVMTTDGSPGYAFLRSGSGYDLRGHHVGVELVQAATQGGVSQALVITRDAQNRLALIVTATDYNVYEVVSGTPTNHVVARMAGERFLRIGESGGVYTADVSADQQTWRPLRSAPLTFAFDNVMLGLESGVPGTAINPDTTVWDNFNAP